MTAILLRVVIIGIIFAAIFFGARRIWRHWKGEFKAVDKARHERDLAERKRSDVIELKRNKDGVFRPRDEGE